MKKISILNIFNTLLISVVITLWIYLFFKYLKADKSYQSKKNAALLKKRNLKNHILKKAYKNKPLTHWEKKFNKCIGQIRFKVERTFRGIKRWFSVGTARYRSINKMPT